jgi:hypothetical protein
MIYKCNVPLMTSTGTRNCDLPATHFDSRALPRRHLYCELHRRSDDPPIGLIDMLKPDWASPSPSTEPKP